MIVNNCKSCGKYIHVGKGFASKCMYCGSNVEYEELKDNTYMELLIDVCETALAGSSGTKATELYDICIEKFPNISKLYWGRFLARHSCKTDRQLLIHGVCFAEDPDFVLACRFATAEEKKCYEQLTQCRDILLADILSELENSKKKLILQTNIKSVQEETAREIEILKAALEQKMAELDFAEKKVRDKKADCMVAVVSNRKVVDFAVADIDKHKSHINGLKEIENSDFYEWTIELERDYQICSKSHSDIKNMQNGMLYKELQQLEQKQADAQRRVSEIIAQVNEVDNRVCTIISQVDSIKEKHKEARESAKKMSFASATSILGADKMNSILFNALQS